nr:SAM-dependent DNA methyltransferase [Euryarchaeota archaeon]
MAASSKEQVVSKQRVADHGEVFTAEREVNAMLDLVAQETARIDSRFLEPACGTGNFLTAILERKLKVVHEKHASTPISSVENTILSIASIYGIDILEDNVVCCRKKLEEQTLASLPHNLDTSLFSQGQSAINFILSKNIIWGDSLTLSTVGPSPGPILFSEWSSLGAGIFKRRDFEFAEMLRRSAAQEEMPLFSDLGEEVFIPRPVREYPKVHFSVLANDS